MRKLIIPGVALAALAAGACLAVVASGAGAGNKITIGDNPGDPITVYGSRRDDTITYGGFTEGVTVQANRAITSLRRDCEVSEASPESAFCSRQKDDAYTRLDTRLGKGADHMEFYDSFDAPGFRIIGAGGSGGDNLNGTEGRDELRGGRGGDILNGLEGDDDLDGGPGGDDCDGGDGDNDVRRCEDLR
jgi:Ca2+-binding RTX toxin-like protein